MTATTDGTSRTRALGKGPNGPFSGELRRRHDECRDRAGLYRSDGLTANGIETKL
jgi:hypothetical protein